jgi:hypothetical protein
MTMRVPRTPTFHLPWQPIGGPSSQLSRGAVLLRKQQCLFTGKATPSWRYEDRCADGATAWRSYVQLNSYLSSPQGEPSGKQTAEAPEQVAMVGASCKVA